MSNGFDRTAENVVSSTDSESGESGESTDEFQEERDSEDDTLTDDEDESQVEQEKVVPNLAPQGQPDLRQDTLMVRIRDLDSQTLEIREQVQQLLEVLRQCEDDSREEETKMRRMEETLRMEEMRRMEELRRMEEMRRKEEMEMRRLEERFRKRQDENNAGNGTLLSGIVGSGILLGVLGLVLIRALKPK